MTTKTNTVDNYKSLTITPEMVSYFEMLKDSPIVDANKSSSLSTLCDSIPTVLGDVNDFLEHIEDFLESHNFKQIFYIEQIRERTFQAIAISDVIKEKVHTPDYTKLDNLFYNYRKLTESKK